MGEYFEYLGKFVDSSCVGSELKRSDILDEHLKNVPFIDCNIKGKIVLCSPPTCDPQCTYEKGAPELFCSPMKKQVTSLGQKIYEKFDVHLGSWVVGTQNVAVRTQYPWADEHTGNVGKCESKQPNAVYLKVQSSRLALGGVLKAMEDKKLYPQGSLLEPSMNFEAEGALAKEFLEICRGMSCMSGDAS